MSHPASKHPLRHLLVAMVIVAVIVGSTHYPALSARALAFDDHQYLVNNALVRHPSGSAAWQFLSEVRNPSTVGGYYQPLTMISLMLDTAVGGSVENLRVYHRTSLILHVANTLLIMTVLYLLFDDVLISGLVALLFGVHPLTVEPISWLSERKTLLAAFFALSSTIAYVQYTKAVLLSPKSRIQNPKSSSLWYLASIGSYVLALLSKPTSTPLPLAFLLMDIWPLQRFNKKTLLEKIPHFVIGAISAVITYISQAATFVETPAQYGPLRIPLVVCHNIVFYPIKMIWPANLSSFYAYPTPLSAAQPMILAGLIGSGLLIAALILLWRRGIHPPFIAWLIFMSVLFPTLGVIGFTVVIASDKYVYLPAIGLLMLLAWGLKHLLVRRRIFAKVCLLGFAFVIIGLEVRTSRACLHQWQSTERLYTYMLALAPNQPQLHFGLGYHYQFQGKLDEARREYALALDLDPSRKDARLNLAVILVDQGRPNDAIPHYWKLLESQPQDVEVRNNLGSALGETGDLGAAAEQYLLALDLNPNFAMSYNNLGVVLGKTGKLDKAMEHFEKAIQLRPDYSEAWKNLAAVYWRQGRMDMAIRAYRSLLGIDSDNADVTVQLSRALVANGGARDAEVLLRDYLARHPNQPVVSSELEKLPRTSAP